MSRVTKMVCNGPNVRVERAARDAAGAPQEHNIFARLRRAHSNLVTDRSNA